MFSKMNGYRILTKQNTVGKLMHTGPGRYPVNWPLCAPFSPENLWVEIVGSEGIN